MKSYFHQPSTTPYVYETLPERVKKLAEEAPDKIAIVVYHSKEERYQITRKELYDQSLRFARALLKLGVKKGDHVAYCVSNCIYWKELYDQSLRFARALLKLGVKKGDRVAYCVSNCIDWLAYDLGIMAVGGIAIHLLLGAIDIKTALAGCDVIILDSKEQWGELLSVVKIHPGGKIVSEAIPSLRLGIAVSPDGRPVNTPLASELMAEIDAKDPGSFLNFPYVDPEDTAFINQTSGTTGTPKKVEHSHFNVINSGIAHTIGIDYTSNDVLFNSRPMAYIGGYPFGFLGSGQKIISGDTIYLSDPKNFETVIDIWRQEGCTLVGVGPHNLKDLRDFGFKVKTIASGGDLLTKDMIKNSFIFGDRMLLVYASTEAIVISLRLFTKDNLDEHLQGMLGRPFPGVEVKVVNEQDEIVDIGEAGLLAVRSSWISKVYHVGSVSHTLKNGWFRTTDVCVMLPGGDLLMKGRTSDFIIKGTVNLPIQLIESYVDRHPDVQKVVVVGTPDPSCGEDVCACVQIYPGRKFDSDALRKFCESAMHSKNSFDSVSMVPSYFLQFEDFPTIASGKLDKKKLKEMATAQIKIAQSKN